MTPTITYMKQDGDHARFCLLPMVKDFTLADTNIIDYSTMFCAITFVLAENLDCYSWDVSGR